MIFTEIVPNVTYIIIYYVLYKQLKERIDSCVTNFRMKCPKSCQNLISVLLSLTVMYIINLLQDEGDDDLFPGSEEEGSETEKEDLFGESEEEEEEEEGSTEEEESEEEEEEEESEEEQLTGFQAELAARLVWKGREKEREEGGRDRKREREREGGM